MSRQFRPLRASARAAWPACLLAIAASTAPAQAQEPERRTAAEPAAAAAPAAPGEEPRRRRERRRVAEAVPTAATAAPDGVAATGQGRGSEAELICKDIKPIGSRIPRRVCATEAQWGGSSEETAAHAQEQLRQIRDRAALTGGSPSGPASISAPTRF